MRFVNAVVAIDLTLAALGALSAWYLARPEMYGLCFQVLLGGLLIKVVIRAYESIKASWRR